MILLWGQEQTGRGFPAGQHLLIDFPDCSINLFAMLQAKNQGLKNHHFPWHKLRCKGPFHWNEQDWGVQAGRKLCLSSCPQLTHRIPWHSWTLWLLLQLDWWAVEQHFLIALLLDKYYKSLQLQRALRELSQRHCCLWDFPAEGQALNLVHGWYVPLKLLQGSLAAPPVAFLTNQDLSGGDQVHCILGKTPTPAAYLQRCENTSVAFRLNCRLGCWGLENTENKGRTDNKSWHSTRLHYSSCARSFQGNPGILGTGEGFSLHPSQSTKVGLVFSFSLEVSTKEHFASGALYVLSAQGKGQIVLQCGWQSDAVPPPPQAACSSHWGPHCHLQLCTVSSTAQVQEQERESEVWSPKAAGSARTHSPTIIHAAFGVVAIWSSFCVTPLRISPGKCLLGEGFSQHFSLICGEHCSTQTRAQEAEICSPG